MTIEPAMGMDQDHILGGPQLDRPSIGWSPGPGARGCLQEQRLQTRPGMVGHRSPFWKSKEFRSKFTVNGLGV